MIDLTPLDVRKKKGDFTKALRGYEPVGVDSFLDLVADRFEELVRENNALRERLTDMSASLEAFRQREHAMNEALISAQQLREEVRAQSTREADLALREAQVEAERIVGQARRDEEAILDSLRRAQAARARYLRSFRSLVERQIEEIEIEEERIKESDAIEEAQASPAGPPAPFPSKR